MSIKNLIIKNWPIIASLLLIAILVASYFVFPDFNAFANEAYTVLLSDDDAAIKRWVEELGFWGPLFIILAMVVQMFLIFIPSPLLMVVAVLAYGPVWGALLAIVSIMISSTIGYFVGAMIGKNALYRLLGKSKEQKMEGYVADYGLWVVIISRVSPAFSNDAISFVAGILKMKYLHFIAATFVGITPLAVLIGWFGENNDRLQAGLIWTSIICAVLFVGYLIFDRRRKKKIRLGYKRQTSQNG